MPELHSIVIVYAACVELHKEKQLRFNYQEEVNSHAIRCMLVDSGSLADRLRSYVQ